MTAWRVGDDPHYAWFEVMEGERQVANTDRKEDAERIVQDHNTLEYLQAITEELAKNGLGTVKIFQPTGKSWNAITSGEES